MIWIIVALCCSNVWAENGVYEVVGTDGRIAGFYVATDTQLTFRKLGDGTAENTKFLYIYQQNPKEWRLGIGKNVRHIRDYYKEEVQKRKKKRKVMGLDDSLNSKISQKKLLFLASQDALEVMRVTELLTE